MHERDEIDEKKDKDQRAQIAQASRQHLSGDSQAGETPALRTGTTVPKNPRSRTRKILYLVDGCFGF